MLRSVAWFDGAGSGMALAVLAGWAVLGTVLLLVGRARPVLGNRESARAVSEV